jgi:hypothetical protein
VERFLEAELKRGMQEGTWVFLFDSFDELPEVLGTRESDVVLREYASAISDFLHGFNICRGVIASRAFRGPSMLPWPRFRILPLTPTRRLELIRKADLDPVVEQELIAHLGLSEPGMLLMATNPMFLGLLCEHIRVARTFPDSAHAVFETFVQSRFERDKERVARRFRVDPADVRPVAELAAFCMAADAGLGLSPSRTSLFTAMQRFDYRDSLPIYNVLLDSLEYMKLARTEPSAPESTNRAFTFAHRRFQEYFATCVVLREPSKVTAEQLLSDGRWRETAVVMCQTQPVDGLHDLLVRCDERLEAAAALMQTALCATQPQDSDLSAPDAPRNDGPFSWPTGALSLVEMLQDGFANRLSLLPTSLRANAGLVVQTGFDRGALFDKKWALDVAGAVPDSVLARILRSAFETNSQWLRDAAYQQVSRVPHLSDDIGHAIRSSLIQFANSGRLRRERLETAAYLSRLPAASTFLNSMRLLLWRGPIEALTHIAAALLLLLTVPHAPALKSWQWHLLTPVRK